MRFWQKQNHWKLINLQIFVNDAISKIFEKKKIMKGKWCHKIGFNHMLGNHMHRWYKYTLLIWMKIVYFKHSNYSSVYNSIAKLSNCFAKKKLVSFKKFKFIHKKMKFLFAFGKIFVLWISFFTFCAFNDWPNWINVGVNLKTIFSIAVGYCGLCGTPISPK